MNPDDGIIEPCVVCRKQVIVFAKSILVTWRGARWSFCSVKCMKEWEPEILFEEDSQ